MSILLSFTNQLLGVLLVTPTTLPDTSSLNPKSLTEAYAAQVLGAVIGGAIGAAIAARVLKGSPKWLRGSYMFADFLGGAFIGWAIVNVWNHWNNVPDFFKSANWDNLKKLLFGDVAVSTWILTLVILGVSIYVVFAKRNEKGKEGKGLISRLLLVLTTAIGAIPLLLLFNSIWNYAYQVLHPMFA